MPRRKLIEEKLTGSAIGEFFEVYNVLGFGFLEAIYIRALEWELRERGHGVARQMGVNVRYKSIDVGQQRIDLLVDGKLVIETKSTLELHKSASRQLYNYLHATNLEVGLLFHFGPDAKFYRVFCGRKVKKYPDESDVSVECVIPSSVGPA